MDLDTLITRLEASTGADREIDCWLENICGTAKFDYEPDSKGPGQIPIRVPPRSYTSSLDAIAALIERVLPEREWWRVSMQKTDAYARINFGAQIISADGKTPALALCLAFARALRAVKQKEA